MESPKLIVMRHAKTNVESASGDDFSRALTPRGSADAEAMGSWLHGRYPGLDRIVSSTALRTRQTVATVIAAWGESPPPTIWDEALYLADLPTLLGVVEQQLPQTTLLVGHNPGLEDLVCYLVADLESRISAPKLMPTSAVYVLELVGRRSPPVAGSAVLLTHMRPSMLGPP